MPPKLIGPYRVLETLGSGGVGTVYRAMDRRSSDVVALKLLSTGPALDARHARRLAREFETLADLSHPNVVKVFDTGVYQGYPYLAMELIEGLTLRHYLSLRGEDLLSSTGSYSVGGGRSTASLLRAAAAAAPAARGPASGGWDDQDSDSWDASRTDDATGGPGGFDLDAFAEEAPSEEAGYDDAHGPDALRALARDMDEPLTPDSDSVDLLPAPPLAERAAPRLERIDASVLEELNRPERVGRLKDAMVQVSEALAYIHAHGLVHRDLKPSNIMVDEDRQVRLMDFGLAKFLADDSVVTQDGRLVGTFRYMAPEQILGENLDARADLYGLGVILYELLTGRPPFDARTPYELWQKVLETEPVPVLALNTRADVQLARVAHRLLRKEPDDRYQTAEEVSEALNE